MFKIKLETTFEQENASNLCFTALFLYFFELVKLKRQVMLI